MADKFDELATALGHLVVAFNDLEVALGGALMYLLKQDEEVGAAFTAHLGVATKIRLLQDLDRRIEDENTRCEFSGLVKRALEINMERNRYIHSEYWSVPTTEQLTVMLRRSLRNSNKPVNYPITIGELTKEYVNAANEEEIMDLANDAAQLAMHLLHLSERLH
jgi:hypothetical protein